MPVNTAKKGWRNPASRKKKISNSDHGLVFEALEPRLLLSADLAGAAAAQAAIAAEAATAEEQTQTSAAEALLIEDDILVGTFAVETQPENVVPDQIVKTQDAASESSQPYEVVFVDTGVENYQLLLDDLQKDTQTRYLEVILLDHTRDGIAQITDALSQKQDVDAIHILSHGSDQAVQLGSKLLSQNNLTDYADQISQWQSALTENADLLLYGCDLAANEGGQSLLNSLAELTLSDVTASSDLTGSASLGGDWELEYNIGQIEIGVAFSAQAQDEWIGLLDTSSGLTAHWTFDTDASDSSNSNNGTLTNGASIDTTDSTDKVGVAKLSLDGTNDYVNLDSHVGNFSGLTQGTISSWIKTTGTSQSIVTVADTADTDSYVNISIAASGYLTYEVFENGSPLLAVYNGNGPTINDGAWHHVAVTIDSSGNSLFLDGEKVSLSDLIYDTGSASTRSFFNDVTGLDAMAIGRNENNSGGYSHFGGLLDDVRVYDRALSNSDITELYNSSGGSITVDTTNDTIDGTTTDVATLLANKGADGFVSLREAILAVNNDSATEWTINVGAGTYSFSAGSGDSAGDFDIRNSVSIIGAGIGSTIIDANTNDRVFQVLAGTVRFEGMTIQDGGGNNNGAGINVASGAELTIDGVNLFNNFATSSNAGGIYNSGTLTVTNSTFDSNTANNGSGGALYQSDTGLATISNSLFVGNVATNGSGGAISAAGTVTVTNSTFSGNSVTGFNSGSAISVRETATLQNVTLTANTGGSLGAVRVNGGDTLNISNTIIAGNTASTDNDLSLNGTATVNDMGNNLIGDGTGQSDLVDGVNGNQVGTSGSPLDPRLGALADNGGSTQTHALLQGSTAINAGNNSGAPLQDQRGYARHGNVDIGAYESHIPTDLSSGIELNNDGGNDAYLISNSGLATSLSATTFEIQFAANNIPNETVFLSFNNATGDEYSIQLNALTSGLELDLGSDGLLLSTVIDYEAVLLDGKFHSLAVTWDMTNGDWAVYIDGEFIDSGTALNAGNALDTTNGQFVFGQEQDGLDSGYAANQHFSGTIYDVRIWNEVRSEAEISLNYQNKFDSGSLPTSLVANWQMDGFNGSNKVVDVVNGNNLSIDHAIGAGFTTSIPVEDLHVSMHANTGTNVGFVVPTDPDVSNDLVSDGGFLKGDPGSWLDYTQGQAFGDWTVASGAISHTSQFVSPLGGLGLELQRVDGDFPSAITQTLATVAGQQYQLIFNMTGNFSGGDAVKYLTASAAGQSSNHTVTDTSGAGHVYEPRTMTFTADSASTVLQFTSGADDGYAAIISDVRVIEIPAAITTILNNDSTLSYDAGTGKFYRFVNSPTNFNTALSAANASKLNGHDGQLVTIRSQYENELVRQHVLDSGNQIWIGTYDTNDDGNWNWLEGNVESDEQFWAGGTAGSAVSGFYSPEFYQSEGAGEDYARMLSGGEWSDTGEGANNAYVIEWDANDVLSSYTFSLTDASNNFGIDSSTGEITVAATSTLDYETATSHDVDITVTDAAGNSRLETVTIRVDSGIEPTQSVPGAQSVNEDQVLTFSNSNSNAVTVTDTKGYTDTPLQVFISVNDGVLTLSQTTGLSILSGSNDSTSMTIHGTESDINAALEGMTFTPDTEFSGAVTLNITTSLGADLIGNYEFEGNANDTSVGITQHGTFVDNATTVVDGIRGQVLSLDGTGDYVEINSEFNRPADATLAAWVNFTATDTFGGEVISIGNGLFLRVDFNMEATALYYDGSSFNEVTSGINIGDGNWHHLAFSFDDTANTQTLYVDGVAVGTGTFTGSIDYANTGFTTTRIGAHPNNADDNFDFNGLIDDARIYTRALSADEIGALATDQTETSDSVAITVNAVNDAPTATNLNAAESYTEDTPLNLTDIVVSDVDSSNVTVTLTLSDVGAGTLNTATSNAVTSTFVGGVWTASGAIADVNTLLAGVIFTPTLNYNSNFTIATSVDDGVATAITGSKTMTGSAVNDDPTNAGSLPSDISVTEDVASNVDLSLIDLSDVDENGGSLTVTLTTSTGGNLTATAGSGITIGGSASARTLTGTQTDLNNYLNTASNITYLHGTPNTNGNNADTIQVQVNDNGNTGAGGGTNINLGTVSVDITATNDAPVSDNDNATVNEGSSVNINLAGNDSDPDNALDLASISIISGPANGSLVINNNGTVDYTHNGSQTISDSFTYTIMDVSGAVSNVSTVNITVTPVNDAPTTSGIGNVQVDEDSPASVINLFAAFDDIEDQDSNLSYTIVANTNPGVFSSVLIDNSAGTLTLAYAANQNGNSDLTIRATDSGGLFIETSFTVIVNPVNDVPQETLPDDQEIEIDASLVFSTANGNAISIADIDAGNTPFSITLSVSNGVLSLAQTNNLSFSYGDGNDDQSLSFSGTITDINAALDGLRFTPNNGFTGATSIELELTDPGSPSIGDPFVSKQTIGIVIRPNEVIIEPPPEVTEPDPVITPVPAPEPVPEPVDESPETDAPDDGTQEDKPASNPGEKVSQTLPGFADFMPAFTPDSNVDAEPIAAASVSFDNSDIVNGIARDIASKLKIPSSSQQKETIVDNNFTIDPGLLRELDLLNQELSNQLEQDNNEPLIIKHSAEIGGAVLVAGAVKWLMQASSLFASLLGTLPAWRWVDPLPVLVKSTEEDGTDRENNLPKKASFIKRTFHKIMSYIKSNQDTGSPHS